MSYGNDREVKFLEGLLQREECLPKEEPTVLEILNRQYDEDLISRLLRYALHADRGLVGRLLAYAQGADLITEVELVSAECEKAMSGGRADLFVTARDGEGKNYVLIIENKTISWEHGAQTQYYFDFVQRQSAFRRYEKAFLFLKPDFNRSPVVCKAFRVLPYSGLLERMSEETFLLRDLKRHLKKYLTNQEVLMETDQIVLENYGKLKAMLSRVDLMLNNFRRDFISDLFTGGKIKQLDCDPFEKHKKEGGADWSAEAEGSSYRIFRKKWWSEDKSQHEKKDKYFFYAEILFDDQDPRKIRFQAVVKSYGTTPSERIAEKFLASRHFQWQGNAEGRWYVFDSELFQSGHAVLSEEWKAELRARALEVLPAYLDELDEIFADFEDFLEKKG